MRTEMLDFKGREGFFGELGAFVDFYRQTGLYSKLAAALSPSGARHRPGACIGSCYTDCFYCYFKGLSQ
jgi:hypothetical protein